MDGEYWIQQRNVCVGLLQRRLRGCGLPPVPELLLAQLEGFPPREQYYCVRGLADDPHLMHIERLQQRLKRLQQEQLPPGETMQEPSALASVGVHPNWLGPLPSWSSLLIVELQQLNTNLQKVGGPIIGEPFLKRLSLLDPRDQYMCIWRVNMSTVSATLYARAFAAVNHFIVHKLYGTPIPDNLDE